MQIVIELPEQTYKRIRWLVNEDVGLCSPVDKAIAHGIPLDDIKVERYNNGFVDGYKKAAEQANACIDDIKKEILEATKCHYGNKCLGANCPSNTDCMIMGEHAIEIIDRHTSRKEYK